MLIVLCALAPLAVLGVAIGLSQYMGDLDPRVPDADQADDRAIADNLDI